MENLEFVAYHDFDRVQSQKDYFETALESGLYMLAVLAPPQSYLEDDPKRLLPMLGYQSVTEFVGL
ncbi:hypothetical protein [Piscirickettsia salmonis]|uniref:hypothetical protein n=1 Tax=Piscirickettsia salmonis TaxID=1238 RepID=UPI00094B56E6|nr:hypothetical protein [Piscirickettsia salmonis]PEQ16133.1 hypothetical protein X973_09005 [Piscirickettsia salmonis]QHS32836.1 hypothetical protein GW535_10350 [Piscirickettsia salmonis]